MNEKGFVSEKRFVSKKNLSRAWRRLFGKVLNSKEEIEANTSENMIAGAEAVKEVYSSLDEILSPTLLWKGESIPTTSASILASADLQLSDDIRNYSQICLLVNNQNDISNYQATSIYAIVQDIIDFSYNDNIRWSGSFFGNATSYSNIGCRIVDNNYNMLRVYAYNNGTYRAKFLKIWGIK